ncbi:MAG TPA: hypothetical protein VK493_06335, partial [Bryobacteraceae bacterium]|nr:hypothetical protein [Bryobacteraceae bacterium]
MAEIDWMVVFQIRKASSRPLIRLAQRCSFTRERNLVVTVVGLDHNDAITEALTHSRDQDSKTAVAQVDRHDA